MTKRLLTSCNMNDLHSSKMRFIAAKKLSLLLDNPMRVAQYWYLLLYFFPWYKNAMR